MTVKFELLFVYFIARVAGILDGFFIVYLY